MKWIFVFLLTIHGLIHLMGVAKAFHLAELSQLTLPISRGWGIVWLAAGLSMLVSAFLLASGQRIWWVVVLVAVVLSQVAILGAWSDAWAGSILNVVALVVGIYGFASLGPVSLRAQYERQVEQRAGPLSASPITEAHLEPLPEPLQRYLRAVGAVGRTRAVRFQARWTGRIRGGPEEAWMEFTAQQQNDLDEPSRLFLMDARRGGLPVDVYHEFAHQEASMRVRLLSLFPLVNAAGPDLTQAEVVTLFNDMTLLAPSALVDPDIRWEAVDERSVRGFYTVGPHTVSAVLHFDDAGELVDFVSDDRLAATPGGNGFVPMRWSTPVSGYRDFGNRRTPSRGEGRWHPPEGEFVYLELELLELVVNQGR